jgi:glycosyltransferase involved in cell wall biosynthesis
MKILYVSTISNTINAFLIPHIKLLSQKGYIVDIATNIKDNQKIQHISEINEILDIPFSRSPFSLGNIKSFRIIKKNIKRNNYDFIHTHSPISSMIIRLALIRDKNIKVIYTAHGFHFFKGSSLLSWLIYYPIEKYLSKFTDVLITINNEDYEIANRFKATSKYLIPGIGVDFDKFSKNDNQVKKLKSSLAIRDEAIVILSVGELNKNKNHQVIIKSIYKMKNKNLHYLICGEGSSEISLKKLAETKKLTDQVHFLGFRNDINEIMNQSDIFVFPSFREGLPIALIEAMHVGMIIICSNIRGNQDLIKNNLNGFIVNKNNVRSYVDKLNYVLQNKNNLNYLRDNSINDSKKYDLKAILKKMETIYDNNQNIKQKTK